MLTASQFAWRIVGCGPCVPPVPKKGARYGSSASCWLCGGRTEGLGWVRETWLPPTFANHNQARSPTSDAVCGACVAMSGKEAWETYVAAHPEMGLKTGHAMSWRFYSHVFADGHHRCPKRPEWRDILIKPPEPPFLLVMATSGQKHLIFRARVSHGRERYWLQYEEQGLLIDRERMTRAISLVEQALALGLYRTEIETGQWRHARPKSGCSLSVLSDIRERLDAWRRARPQEFEIACYVAHAQDIVPTQEIPCSTDSTPSDPKMRLLL